MKGKGSNLNISNVKKNYTVNNSNNFSTNSNYNQKGNFSKTQIQPKIEDEYITNLQKQIYYLELEMKLMKDKELETKNKVGGFEILFRDGVPLNEHFLALKTKYTNERDQFDKIINDLNSDLHNINNENKFLQNQIDEINNNYYDIIQKTSSNTDFYSNKIFDLNSRLTNENNTKNILLKEKEIRSKNLHKLNSDNVHYLRTLEKNKLFVENTEEKNNSIKEKNIQKFEDIDKLVVKSLLEYEALEKKMEKNSKGKFIENENTMMILTINKLERDLHMSKAKISELENNQVLNKKYLHDEEIVKKIHEKENKKLNDELDGVIKLNEEILKQKVKENEKNQSIIIKNSIANNELKMGVLLTKYKEEEADAKELLEEKNSIAQKIISLNEIIESQLSEEFKSKQEIIHILNAIDEIETYIEDNQSLCNSLIIENEKLKHNADRNEKDIENLNKKIEELQQKIELNTILKDIDINELKMLSQNNALVNSSINNLITKWDKVQSKLHEIEENQKFNR